MSTTARPTKSPAKGEATTLRPREGTSLDLPAPVTAPPWVSAPPFLGPAHQALGEELEAALRVPGVHDALENPEHVGAELAALGLFRLLVPATDGGRSFDDTARGTLDVRALCVAREALAYVSPLADGVLAVQGLGAHAVVLTPSFPGRTKFLEEVVSGARLGAFAATEPEAGSDLSSLRTVAERDEGGYLLTGEKAFISNVGIAHRFLVFANAAPQAGKRGISAFLVPADAPGLRLEAQQIAGHPIGRMHMERCRVPASALVGEVGMGLRFAYGTLETFRTSVGGAAVGIARRALDEATAHVRRRQQFGKALADFQLTQAALADMATDIEASRLLVLRAAWLKDHGSPDAAVAVAMAKAFATEAAGRVVDRAVQLHGGRGVEEGSVLEALTRAVRPLRIYEGTTEIQKIIIGGHLTRST